MFGWVHELLGIGYDLFPVRCALQSPRNSLLRLVVPHLHAWVPEQLHSLLREHLPQRHGLLVVRAGMPRLFRYNDDLLAVRVRIHLARLRLLFFILPDMHARITDAVSHLPGRLVPEWIRLLTLFFRMPDLLRISERLFTVHLALPAQRKRLLRCELPDLHCWVAASVHDVPRRSVPERIELLVVLL